MSIDVVTSEPRVAAWRGAHLGRHCLPAHRGEEVASDVIDGPRSVVFDQVENRLHTAQAVLSSLLLDQLEGAR